jgi:hypothetical protein
METSSISAHTLVDGGGVAMAEQAPRISADVSGEQLINDINAALTRIWKRRDKIEALASARA